MPEIQEWQKRLLQRAEEIWKAGEGEIVFTVFRRNKESPKEWKLEKKEKERGKENNG